MKPRRATRRKTQSVLRELCEAYLTARETVSNCGFADEIVWQESRSVASLSESDFLRQAAWAVLSAGMSERVVRKVFPGVSAAFLDWSSARRIVRRQATCQKDALRVFNHQGKIRAIVSICQRVSEDGFEGMRQRIERDGLEFLRSLQFIGPVTSYHLAKNIGLDVVKPDRHLSRLAAATRFRSPTELCQVISDMIGDKLAVVDVVLWRYATLNRNYTSIFTVTD